MTKTEIEEIIAAALGHTVKTKQSNQTLFDSITSEQLETLFNDLEEVLKKNFPPLSGEDGVGQTILVLDCLSSFLGLMIAGAALNEPTLLDLSRRCVRTMGKSALACFELSNK